jgi:DNA-binding IclR family transcriptional regulator
MRAMKTIRQKVLDKFGDDGRFHSSADIAKALNINKASARVVTKQLTHEGLNLIESKLDDGCIKYRFHKTSENSRANSLFRLVVFGEALQ